MYKHSAQWRTSKEEEAILWEAYLETELFVVGVNYYLLFYLSLRNCKKRKNQELRFINLFVFRQYNSQLLPYSPSEKREKCAFSTIACLHDQNKTGLFGELAFIQPTRAIRKVFKSSDWLEKSRPFKKATFVLIM